MEINYKSLRSDKMLGEIENVIFKFSRKEMEVIE